MSTLPIGDYALLSDCRSAALVSRAGSVDWLCFPRFDGPSVFARLLDEQAGHFWIRPVGQARMTRRHLDQTMVLEATFQTATGTLVLVDALALGADDRGHQLGAGAPGALLRHLRCTDGQVTVEVTYAPRPEYGLIHPLLAHADGGRVLRLDDFRATNGPDLYVYLSGHPAPRSSAELHADGAFEVAPLKGNVGSQNYELPADLDLAAFRSAVICCRRFATVFSTAELVPGTSPQEGLWP